MHANSPSIQIRAYYLDTTDKIIELVGICVSFSCKWKNANGLVGVSASPSSGLTAAVVPGAGSQWGINVFYADADSRLSVASYTKGNLWMNGTAIGPKVAPGSSLAVSAAADQANFQVYFHAADTGALSHISFNNATSTWSPGTSPTAPSPQTHQLTNQQQPPSSPPPRPPSPPSPQSTSSPAPPAASTSSTPPATSKPSPPPTTGSPGPPSPKPASASPAPTSPAAPSPPSRGPPRSGCSSPSTRPSPR